MFSREASLFIRSLIVMDTVLLVVSQALVVAGALLCHGMANHGKKV